MRALVNLLLAAVFGAAFAALIGFLVQGYQLIRRGVQRDAVPFLEMLRDVMHLEWYAAVGAVLGLILAAVALVLAGSRDRRRRGQLAAARVTAADPDALIRMRRAEGAERYLRERDA